MDQQLFQFYSLFTGLFLLELRNTKRWSVSDGLSIVKNMKTGTGQIGKNSNVNIMDLELIKQNSKRNLKLLEEIKRLAEKKIKELEKEEEELKKVPYRILKKLAK